MSSAFVSKLKKRLIALLIVALAVWGFLYLKESKPQQAAVDVQEKAWPIEAMNITLGHYAPFQVLYGQAESQAMVTASSPVTGLIGQVAVKEGQLVKQGEKLLEINEADLRLPLVQARADVADLTNQIRLEKLNDAANRKRLAQERAILKLKQSALERSKQLIAKDLTAQSALDQAKEALARQEYTLLGAELAVEQYQVKLGQLQAKLEKAKAMLERAQLNQTRGVVVAPYDARIAKVMVAQGDSVGVNSQLVRFYALDSLELRAKLPVSKMAQVYADLTAEREVLADLMVAGQTQRVPLTRLAGESTTSGVDAFFPVPQQLKMARPGDLIKIHLLKQPVANSFAVPYTAIYGSDGLYVVEEDRLRFQKITLLGDILISGEVWALVVAKGIKSNQAISITHLPNAITDLKVKVMSDE